MAEVEVTEEVACATTVEVRVDNLLMQKDYMENAVKLFSIFGHDAWLSMGESEACVNAASAVTLEEHAQRIITKGWEAVVINLEDSVGNGGDVSVDITGFKEHALHASAVKSIAGKMFRSLPASESYKYVGDQYETQFILRRHYSVAGNAIAQDGERMWSASATGLGHRLRALLFAACTIMIFISSKLFFVVLPRSNFTFNSFVAKGLSFSYPRAVHSEHR